MKKEKVIASTQEQAQAQEQAPAQAQEQAPAVWSDKSTAKKETLKKFVSANTPVTMILNRKYASGGKKAIDFSFSFYDENKIVCCDTGFARLEDFASDTAKKGGSGTKAYINKIYNAVPAYRLLKGKQDEKSQAERALIHARVLEYMNEYIRLCNCGDYHFNKDDAKQVLKDASITNIANYADVIKAQIITTITARFKGIVTGSGYDKNAVVERENEKHAKQIAQATAY